MSYRLSISPRASFTSAERQEAEHVCQQGTALQPKRFNKPADNTYNPSNGA